MRLIKSNLDIGHQKWIWLLKLMKMENTSMNNCLRIFFPLQVFRAVRITCAVTMVRILCGATLMTKTTGEDVHSLVHVGPIYRVWISWPFL